MPNNNQLTNVKKVTCRNVQQDAKFDQPNFTSNKSDTIEFQSKVNVRAPDTTYGTDKGNNNGSGENKTNTLHLKSSAGPKTKNPSKPADISIKVNMMHNTKKVPSKTSSDKTMQNHEFETRALIEHCRFLAQQLKKAKETERLRSLDSISQSPQEQIAKMKSELRQNLVKYTVDVQEYASKLENTEQELNKTKIKLDATMDKLEQSEKREVALNCNLQAKAKELASLFGKITSLENTQRDLAMQLQVKQDSFDKLSESLRNSQQEQIVAERQVAGKRNAENAKLRTSIEVLSSERDKCMRAIENMNIALNKSESREKLLAEKSDFLTKQLDNTELKLDARTQKLLQAEKREVALKYSIDAKIKEATALSGRVTDLENAKRSLETELQQKQNSIEKLDLAVRDAQKEKIVSERLVADKTSKEIANLKSSVDFLTVQHDSKKREMDNMNAALSKKEAEEKALAEKSDFLSKKLDQAELKLNATAEQLAQAKKREVFLNHSIELKDSDYNSLSEKFSELEKFQEDLISQIQQKDEFIEKLDSTIRDGQKQKVIAVREAVESKSEEIISLKNAMDLLTTERDNGQREIDTLNIALSKKDSEQKMVADKLHFLDKKVNQAELKLGEAKEQLKQAKKREFELNSTIEENEKGLVDLSNHVRELENTNRVLSTQVQQKDTSIGKQNETVRDLQEKIADGRLVLDAKVSENADLKRTIEALKMERNSSMIEFDELNLAFNKKIADEKTLAEKYSQLSKQLNQKDVQLVALKDKLNYSEKREIANKCAMESKEKELDILASKTASLESAHQGLVTEVQMKQDSIEKLNAVVRDAQKEKLLVERNIADNRVEEITNLKRTIDLLTSQRDRGVREIDRISASLCQKETEERSLTEKSKLLAKQLDQAAQKLGETTEQLSQAEKREVVLTCHVESKSKEFQALSNKVRALEKAQKDLNIQVRQKQEAIKKLNHAVEDANNNKTEQRFPVADKSNAELKRLIASLTHERDVALAKLRRQAACIDGLNSRIERLLSDKKEQHEELQSSSIKLLKIEEEKLEWESKFKAKCKALSVLSNKIKVLESTNRDMLIEMQKKEGSIRDLSMVLATWNNEMELTLSEFS